MFSAATCTESVVSWNEGVATVEREREARPDPCFVTFLTAAIEHSEWATKSRTGWEKSEVGTVRFPLCTGKKVIESSVTMLDQFLSYWLFLWKAKIFRIRFGFLSINQYQFLFQYNHTNNSGIVFKTYWSSRKAQKEAAQSSRRYQQLRCYKNYKLWVYRVFYCSASDKLQIMVSYINIKIGNMFIWQIILWKNDLVFST